MTSAWAVVEVGLTERCSALSRWPIHSGEAHLILNGLPLTREQVFEVHCWGDAVPIQLRCICHAERKTADGASEVASSVGGGVAGEIMRVVDEGTLILVHCILPSRADDPAHSLLIPKAARLSLYDSLRSVPRSSSLRMIVVEEPGSMALEIVQQLCREKDVPVFTVSPEDVQCVPPGPDRVLDDAFEAASMVGGVLVIPEAPFLLRPLSDSSPLWVAQLAFVQLLEWHPAVSVVLIVDEADGVADHVRMAMQPFNLIDLRSPLGLPEWSRVLESMPASVVVKASGLSLAEVSNAVQQSLKAGLTLNATDLVWRLSEAANMKSATVVFSPEVPFTYVPSVQEPLQSSWAAVSFASFCSKVVGQTEAKRALFECLILPRCAEPAMRRFLPRGIVLFGPPGTGKTFLVGEACLEARSSLLSVSASDLVRGDVGATEKRIARLFSLAKACAPCVLFFDEAEALLADRKDVSANSRKMIAQFMLEMDALVKASSSNSDVPQVVLIAATNYIERVDPAFLRTGRFDRQVRVSGLCSEEEFALVLASAAAGDVRFQHIDWGAFVKGNLALRSFTGTGPFVRGLTGAQLGHVVHRAALECEGRPYVSEEVLERALFAELFSA